MCDVVYVIWCIWCGVCGVVCVTCLCSSIAYSTHGLVWCGYFHIFTAIHNTQCFSKYQNPGFICNVIEWICAVVFFSLSFEYIFFLVTDRSDEKKRNWLKVSPFGPNLVIT